MYMNAQKRILLARTLRPAEKEVPVMPTITPNPRQNMMPLPLHSPTLNLRSALITKQTSTTSPPLTALFARVLSCCNTSLPKNQYGYVCR